MRRWGTVVLVASLLGACSATKSEVRPGGSTAEGAGAQIGPQGARPDQISTRAMLKFEDAVKAFAAQEQAGTHDWISLENRFKDALNEDANLAEADYNLGLISEKQGKTQEAERYYRSAMAKKPSLTMAGHNLAALQQRSGNPAAAGETYRSVLERSPDDAGAYAGLAELSRLAGNCDQALVQARGALVRDPMILDASKVMMRCHLERKDLALSRLVAQRALKLAPRDPEILMVVGSILLQEGKGDQARAQFKAAAEAQPGYAPAHQMLASLALKDENWTVAEDQLRKLLQVDGRNAEAHLNLGVAYRGMGQPDKAMQEYDEAEKLAPQLAPIYLNRAVILHRVKDAPERALELYRKYVAMAGGEFAVAGDSPVYALIQECEQLITAKAEVSRMEAIQAAKPLEGDTLPEQAPPVQAADEGGTPAPVTGDPFADEPG